jgi:hypothetical protein
MKATIRGAMLIAAAGALAFAASALAGNDKQPIEFNAADQAAARAAVLRRSDLGSASGWTGGPRKPDLSGGPRCANFHPKQSDLVITGAAASDFKNELLEFDSEVQVLRTARMVQLDWQRSVKAPGAIPCLRSTLVKTIGEGGKVLSFEEIPFPRVATYSTAFRIVVEVTVQGKALRLMLQPALVGRGQKEITLIAIAPVAAQASVTAAQVRLARILAARAT